MAMEKDVFQNSLQDFTFFYIKRLERSPTIPILIWVFKPEGREDFEKAHLKWAQKQHFAWK